MDRILNVPSFMIDTLTCHFGTEYMEKLADRYIQMTESNVVEDVQDFFYFMKIMSREINSSSPALSAAIFIVMLRFFDTNAGHEFILDHPTLKKTMDATLDRNVSYVCVTHVKKEQDYLKSNFVSGKPYFSRDI